MKIINHLIIILICFILQACGSIKCPAFTEKLSGWLPYKSNDIVRYVSDNDTILFNVKHVSKTKEYFIPENCDCLCGAGAGFSTDTCSQGFMISGNCVILDSKNPYLEYEFTSNHQADYTSFVYDLYANGVHSVVADTVTYNLNGIEIPTVIAIEKPLSNLIRKIYIHNEKGLIGFVDKNNRAYKLLNK